MKSKSTVCFFILEISVSLLTAAHFGQGPGGGSVVRVMIWIDRDESEPEGTLCNPFAVPSCGPHNQASWIHNGGGFWHTPIPSTGWEIQGALL